MDYELVHQELDDQIDAIVLAKKNEPDTFLDNLSKDPKRRQEAAALRRALIRIALNGVDWAIDNGCLKPLERGDSGIMLFEVKAKRKVYRIMTYLHANTTPVLLFAFEGHVRRGGGGIRPETLRKGHELAPIARKLMKREGTR